MKLFKVSGKKIIAGIGILLLLGVTAGCSESQNLSWEQLKKTHYKMVTGKSPDTKNKAADKEGQAASGDEDTTGEIRGQGNTETAQAQETQGEKVTLALCFADQNGDYLTIEQREIALVPGLARAAVNELIRGPEGKGLSTTIPEGTRLLDINIDNGLCTVDFSSEFRENHWGGSSGEILTVYSVVNTLTQFATVEKVEILVEGQRIETLAGHMDLTVPVYRNTQIIRDTE
ncbi:MAG: hypothetical protein CVU89_02135 [Firmicutes bacterium HGW-Firmicutes-14]|nr:MAG: hypothetical protein CVU89_02135 [Firmicutes bacterium HGW-Firmicutes-14]